MSEPAFRIRTAFRADVPALEALIEASVRGLGPASYTPRQLESALAHLFSLDTQLVDDGTYYVVEAAGTIVACGGWSRRKTPFGGDRMAGARDAHLRRPGEDPAVIRAMFVHPDWTRRGLGRLILEHSEAAARAEGFDRCELTATPMGHPLYAACGYRDVAPAPIRLPDGVTLPNTLMVKP